LADHNVSTKKAQYVNPNERKVNQCTNRFYDHIEEQKTAVRKMVRRRYYYVTITE